MADVYRGRDVLLGRPVAVKVLSPPFDRDRDFVERFRREARAAARLNHPNIVAVFDTGSDGGRHFLVTELVDGEPLSGLLDRTGRLAPEPARMVGRQICSALAAAHAGGVIHRDMKPGNVMLTGNGGVKVVDFGIARAAGVDAMTRTGVVFGSAPYLSPEQARGEAGDERSDLYALGCVLYQALTGRPPFIADSPVAMLYQHVNEQPVPPSSIGPVPAGLEAVVLRCLEKDPGRRFGSATDLGRALEGVAAPAATQPLPVVAVEHVPTRPVPRTPPGAAAAPADPTIPSRSRQRSSGRTRRRAALAGAAVLMVVVVAALASALLDDSPRLRPSAGRGTPGGVSPSAVGETASPSTVASGSPAVALGPPTSVEAAAAALVGAIDDAFVGEGHDEGKLSGVAGRIVERYREHGLEDAASEAEHLFHELEKLVERGTISVESADRVGAAIDDLLSAMQAFGGDEGDDDDEGD
jgi:serine/threonine-protein kinase